MLNIVNLMYKPTRIIAHPFHHHVLSIYETQRQAIFTSYVRRHETFDLWFVTKEFILLFKFEMFF